MQRIGKGAAATLTLEVHHGDTDAHVSVGSPITISVVDAAGSTVVASTNATGATSPYTYSLAAQANLGLLTATWVGSGGTFTTEHDVVGRRYASLVDIRAAHDELVSGGDYSDAQILAKRDAVELEMERIAGLAFVRRRSRLTLSGTDQRTLQLPVRYVRRIVSCTINGSALSAGDIATIERDDDDPPGSCSGVLAWDSWWTAGRRNIVIDVEHGFDAPPEDVRDAFLRLMYWRLHARNTEVLDRAVSFGAGGGTYQLDVASSTSTGVPEINAVLSRYSKRGKDGKRTPASRPLRWSTQRAGSLFHR